MAFHSGEGGFFDSAFEFLGGALGGAIGGPVGAAVGSRLGAAVIGGASSVAPISAQTAGLVLGGVLPGGTPTFAPPIGASFDTGQFAPIVRTVAPFALPVAREISRRFLERGPAVTNGSLVTIPAPGGQVVCKPVSRREIVLLRAKAHSPGATARKIIRAAKECGMEIAAGMFGLPILDVCFLVINQPRRRAKGISARDMRTTNRTLRGIDRVRRNAKKALGGR